MQINPSLCAVTILTPSLFFSTQLMAEDTETFLATMKLLAPIVITETQALSFADTVSGVNSTVVTAAADGAAATFTATGEPSRAVTGSVVEASIDMITNVGATAQEVIVVDTFTTGGDLDGTGSGTFNASGALNNLQIGATANVSSDDIPGDYQGTATFRLVYQ